jgi:glutamate synthase domain-containing protein 3
MRRVSSCAVRCNRASVDLDPVVDPEGYRPHSQLLITRHAELTGSPRAKWILDNWETMLPKFIKVSRTNTSACWASSAHQPTSLEALRRPSCRHPPVYRPAVA